MFEFTYLTVYLIFMAGVTAGVGIMFMLTFAADKRQAHKQHHFAMLGCDASVVPTTFCLNRENTKVSNQTYNERWTDPRK